MNEVLKAIYEQILETIELQKNNAQIKETIQKEIEANEKRMEFLEDEIGTAEYNLQGIASKNSGDVSIEVLVENRQKSNDLNSRIDAYKTEKNELFNMTEAKKQALPKIDNQVNEAMTAIRNSLDYLIEEQREMLTKNETEYRQNILNNIAKNEESMRWNALDDSLNMPVENAKVYEDALKNVEEKSNRFLKNIKKLELIKSKITFDQIASLEADIKQILGKEEEKIQPPAEQKPVEQKPVEQKPVEQKPVEQKPVEQKPVEQKPEEKKPVEQKLAEQKPTQSKTETLENSFIIKVGRTIDIQITDKDGKDVIWTIDKKEVKWGANLTSEEVKDIIVELTKIDAKEIEECMEKGLLNPTIINAINELPDKNINAEIMKSYIEKTAFISKNNQKIPSGKKHLDIIYDQKDLAKTNIFNRIFRKEINEKEKNTILGIAQKEFRYGISDIEGSYKPNWQSKIMSRLFNNRVQALPSGDDKVYQEMYKTAESYNKIRQGNTQGKVEEQIGIKVDEIKDAKKFMNTKRKDRLTDLAELAESQGEQDKHAKFVSTLKPEEVNEMVNEGSLNSRQIIREMAGIDKENKISQIKNHVSKVKDSKATKKIVGVAKKAKNKVTQKNERTSDDDGR